MKRSPTLSLLVLILLVVCGCAGIAETVSDICERYEALKVRADRVVFAVQVLQGKAEDSLDVATQALSDAISKANDAGLLNDAGFLIALAGLESVKARAEALLATTKEWYQEALGWYQMATNLATGACGAIGAAREAADTKFLEISAGLDKLEQELRR